MVSNTVDANKKQGLGPKRKAKVVATGLSPKDKEFTWGGKYQAPILDYGRDGDQYSIGKYKPNTPEVLNKRMGRKRNSEGLIH